MSCVNGKGIPPRGVSEIEHKTIHVKIRGLFLHWVFPFLVTLYVWHQSHFQFEQYWPPYYRSAVHAAMIYAVVIMFVLGCRRAADSRLIGFVLLLVATTLFYGLLEHLATGVFSLGAIKAAIIAVALIQMMETHNGLKRLLLVNYWIGIIGIALSTIPLLHFLDFVQLSYEQVSRVGGTTGRPDLDPLSFGLFGRTESYPHGSIGIPRLQGWSSEPLHWSYFIYCTIVCWVLVYPQSASISRRSIHWLGMIVILVQLFFVQSTTAIIVGVACLLSAAVYLYLLRGSRQIAPYVFFVIVLLPGMVAPFVLAGLNSLEHLIVNESVFNEGANWRGKIEFLEIFNLYFRFAPELDMSAVITVSHNLILDHYLRFGYVLIIPLLLQLFVFLTYTTKESSVRIGVAALVLVLAHTLATPGAFFSPSGVMFQLLVFAAATKGLPISFPKP